MKKLFYLNGEPVAGKRVCLDVRDMGLLYGYSLFETMLIKNGQPVLLINHLDRMISSAAQLEVTLPGTYNDLKQMCKLAVARSGVRDGVLRLSVSAGTGEGADGACLLSVSEGVPYTEKQFQIGLSITVLASPRNEQSPLVKHKTANYLENLMGRREAWKGGYDEGIFFNTRAYLAEGTASNIFLVLNGKLVTPPVEAGLLPGTVRGLVLDHAPGIGLACSEVNVSRTALDSAQECFLTNALMGVMPVTRIDDFTLGTGKPGPVTREIFKLYKNLIK